MCHSAKVKEVEEPFVLLYSCQQELWKARTKFQLPTTRGNNCRLGNERGVGGISHYHRRRRRSADEGLHIDDNNLHNPSFR